MRSGQRRWPRNEDRNKSGADRKTLIKSSQHNPILNALYQKITTEEAHHLLHVHYPGEDAQA